MNLVPMRIHVTLFTMHEFLCFCFCWCCNSYGGRLIRMHEAVVQRPSIIIIIVNHVKCTACNLSHAGLDVL